MDGELKGKRNTGRGGRGLSARSSRSRKARSGSHFRLVYNLLYIFSPSRCSA